MTKLRTILFLAALLASLPAAPKELPVEAFASLPQVSHVSISPDGKVLAALVKIKTPEITGTAVRVYNLETGKAEFLTYARAGDFTVNWMRWASNRYLLISARFPAKRYGTPTTETRLMKVNVETKDVGSVLSSRFLRQQEYVPQFQDQIVDMLTDDDEHILIEGSYGGPQTSMVFRVNLATGKTKRLMRPKPNIENFVTDRQGRVRLSVWRDETEYRIKHRAPDSQKWETLWVFDVFSEDVVWPMGFDADPNTLFVRAYADGKYAVFKVDLAASSVKKDLYFSDPDHDVGGALIYSGASDKAIGIRYVNEGGFTFWDDEYVRFQQTIDTALPDTANLIVGMSDDARRIVTLGTSDTEAGAYYVVDRDKNSMTRFASRYPSLDSSQLVEKQAIRYEARDGLEIEGVLTLPNRQNSDELVPAIILPHGGPISFTGSGFDYWTQFFANRGYAVLEMNFRGSSGYGYDFMKSGLQSWGLEMQNDVEDGTRWLLAQGIVDPDRVCVVGASYGGYAALMEAARNPDLYRCAVSFAGVTDVAYLVRSSRRYSNFEIVKEQVGSDYGELRKRSPLTLAEGIDIPVLLAHGTDDRSVRVRHSRRMQSELSKHGKEVKYLELDEGDHYLSLESHRLEFFAEMDEFLKQYLR